MTMPHTTTHPTPPPAHSLANAPFIDCWNQVLAPKWVRFRHLLSGSGQVHSTVAFSTLPLRSGDRVLDIGCGFGETTLELAERVGPAGSVLGLDCARSFLTIAKAEQRAAGVDNVRYWEADVETAPLEPSAFDIAVGRFAIMFCANPVRALRNIRFALQPGGILGLICWRSLAENPCWHAAEQIALRYVPPPTEEATTCGPGPFAMASEASNRQRLTAAGFQDIRHQRIDRPVCVGRTLDEAIAYLLLIGPAGFVLREAGAEGERWRPHVEADLRALLTKHQHSDGSLWLGSSTWFVTARAPAHK